MLKHWLIEIEADGWPALRGPYQNNDTQVAAVHALMAAGKTVYWVDSVEKPRIGTITPKAKE